MPGRHFLRPRQQQLWALGRLDSQLRNVAPTFLPAGSPALLPQPACKSLAHTAGKSEKDIKNLRQEIEILRQLKHENIIQVTACTFPRLPAHPLLLAHRPHPASSKPHTSPVTQLAALYW